MKRTKKTETVIRADEFVYRVKQRGIEWKESARRKLHSVV